MENFHGDGAGYMDQMVATILLLVAIAIVVSVEMFFWGRSSGYLDGYNAADEESWQKNCAVLGDFYICNDLRGFSEEAVTISAAMVSAINVAEFESVERTAKINKGKSYTITMMFPRLERGVRRDTKEAMLLVVGPASEGNKDDTVIASVPIAGLVEKTTAAITKKCEGEDNCDKSAIRRDALYPDAVVLAQKGKEHIEKNFVQK